MYVPIAGNISQNAGNKIRQIDEETIYKFELKQVSFKNTQISFFESC
jgi:hypothetical protein